MIKTDRLSLTPWHYGNILTVVRWLNDKEVVKYSEQRHSNHTSGTQFTYIQSAHLFMEIHKDNTIIGTIASQYDTHNKVANVGILIGDKTQWSKGYGSEAWRGYCDHLFANGVFKIEAGCMNTNRAMMMICLNYGMHKEGVRLNHFDLDGTRTHLMMFGLPHDR